MRKKHEHTGIKIFQVMDAATEMDKPFTCIDVAKKLKIDYRRAKTTINCAFNKLAKEGKIVKTSARLGRALVFLPTLKTLVSHDPDLRTMEHFKEKDRDNFSFTSPLPSKVDLRPTGTAEAVAHSMTLQSSLPARFVLTDEQKLSLFELLTKDELASLIARIL